MNRSDLQRLSNARVREAKVLFAAGEYSGAYYLAGYAVECALKACIAKATQRHDFPDKDRAQKSFSHKLPDLMKVAGLYDEFELAMRSSPALEASWLAVRSWSEQSRYETSNDEKASALLNAISKPINGVLPWIKRRW